jgi:hypothetical protein
MLWTDSNTGPDEQTGEGRQRTTSVLPDSGGGSLLAEDLSPVPAGVSGVVVVEHGVYLVFYSDFPLFLPILLSPLEAFLPLIRINQSALLSVSPCVRFLPSS